MTSSNASSVESFPLQLRLPLLRYMIQRIVARFALVRLGAGAVAINTGATKGKQISQLYYSVLLMTSSNETSVQSFPLQIRLPSLRYMMQRIVARFALVRLGCRYVRKKLPPQMRWNKRCKASRNQILSCYLTTPASITKSEVLSFR